MIRTWIAGIVAVALASSLSAALLQNSPQAPARSANEETAFLCPMHPDFTLDVEGKCPRCGMALVRAAAYDVRDYKLEFRTIPPVVVARQKATLRFKVSHPGFNALIEKFEVVHDRKYHLFVISQDMEFFQHIHPEQGEDGAWSIGVVLPKPGAYAILSDFLPKGGSAQFLARPLVTAGYTGDVLAQSAQLVPDASTTQTVGPLRARVNYDPPIMRAGSYNHITLSITNAENNQPVRELEPYLGAFGHMLIMDEKMFDYVHAHPTEMPAANIPIEEQRGGPDVVFEGLMPKPGLYRAWTQVKYRGELYTFTNTFEVLEIGVNP